MTRRILINLALAGAYLVLGRLGLMMALPPGYVTALWPPAGLALAACLIWGGNRVWPGIFLGALLVNASVGSGFALGWLPLAIAAGNTAQARVAETLLRRLDPALTFDLPSSVLRFTLAVLGSCLIATTVGNSALALLGQLPLSQLPQSLLTWWLGDSLGTLIFTPLLLSLFLPDPLWRSRRRSVGLPLLLAFLLCGLIYIYANKNEEEQTASIFRQQGRELLLHQSNQWRIREQTIDDLAAFFEASDFVSPDEFSQFASVIIRRSPSPHAIHWGTMLHQEDVASHNAAMSQLLGKPYQVWRRPDWQANPDGWVIPVNYIEPVMGNNHLLGLDLNSSPPHAAAFRRALQGRKRVTSVHVPCPSGTQTQDTIALIASVRNRAGKVLGFCYACTPVSQLIAPLEQVKGLNWIIRDLDDNGKLVHRSSEHAFPQFTGDTFLDRTGVYYQESLLLVDRHLHFTFHMPLSALRNGDIPLSTLVLSMALSICALLGTFLLILSGNTRRTEQIVTERTGELRREITLRQQMEDNLANAQHISHTGSWELDHQSGALHWSAEIYRIFEIDPARFGASYESFLQAIHPNDRDAVNQAFTAHLQKQYPYDVEHRLLMPDGRIKHVHERCETERDNSGNPLRSQGTVQDITERKQAELALAYSEASWSATMDHFQDILYVLDTQRRLLRANRLFYQIYDTHPETAIGRHITELVHPQGEPQPCPVCQAEDELRDAVITMETDNPYNQSAHPIEITVKIIRDDDETPNGILVSLHELTHERQLQAAVAESEAKFRSLVENIPGAAYSCMLDEHWTVEYMSNGIEAITGYPASDFINNRVRSFASLILPEDAAHVDQGVRDAVAQQRPFVLEYRIRHADGSVRWLWERGIAQSRSEKGISRLNGVFFDITERKSIEAELALHRDSLENLVAERTAQLEQARIASDAANHAKSIFLANMSHELRTPLNVILGFAQLMERDRHIPDNERANLHIINKSGQHLLTLINDVLEISRIEAGRLTVTPRPMDLHDLLDTLTEVMTQRAASKGLSLRQLRSDSLPRYILCDSGKLRQIILNLLSNAVKYTEHGEIILSSSAICGDQQAELVFEVIDTGVGIEPDSLEKIFHAFYQTEYGIRLGEGTGLGLTICQEYAHLLGGKLTASSVPGSGSTFRFALSAPLSGAPEETPALTGYVSRLAPGQQRYRILVAEDSPDNQYLIREILTRAGFEVRCVSNGNDAVAVYQTWLPHFIWMDMRMPGMDGYAATRAIRALPGGANIPIVALTASAFEEDRPNILAAGCNEVMKKPFENQRLFELLARFLNVEYAYETPDVEPASSDAFADFSVLPAELRQRLHDAAIALDIETVRNIAMEIEPAHATLAHSIRGLIDRYAFDQLAMQLEKAR